MKVVLDPSVIVAATRSDSGAARQVLRAALERRLEPLLSVALALEYESVLKRPEQLNAEEEGVALNQLINVAVAEKLSALRTQAFFRARTRYANVPEAIEILHRLGRGNPPMKGDKLAKTESNTSSQTGRQDRKAAKRRTRASAKRMAPRSS